MDPINPVAGNPEALNQNPQPSNHSNNVPVISMAIFILLSLIVVGFLYYQNQQLKGMLAKYQTPTASPTPTATADPTASWKTYTNNDFSFKYPNSVDLIENKTTVYFTDSSSTYKTTVAWNFPLLTKDFNDELITRDVCPVNTEDGTGLFPGSSEDLDAIPENALVCPYTLSHRSVDVWFQNNTQLYDVSLRAVSPTIPLPYEQRNQLNQILSTFKFLEASPNPIAPPKACTLEAKICPNGSSVGRTGPNCEFAACPTP